MENVSFPSSGILGWAYKATDGMQHGKLARMEEAELSSEPTQLFLRGFLTTIIPSYWQ